MKHENSNRNTQRILLYGGIAQLAARGRCTGRVTTPPHGPHRRARPCLRAAARTDSARTFCGHFFADFRHFPRRPLETVGTHTGKRLIAETEGRCTPTQDAGIASFAPERHPKQGFSGYRSFYKRGAPHADHPAHSDFPHHGIRVSGIRVSDVGPFEFPALRHSDSRPRGVRFSVPEHSGLPTLRHPGFATLRHSDIACSAQLESPFRGGAARASFPRIRIHAAFSGKFCTLVDHLGKLLAILEKHPTSLRVLYIAVHFRDNFH